MRLCRIFIVLLLAAATAQAERFRDGPFIGLPIGANIADHSPVLGWLLTYEIDAPVSLSGLFTYQTDSIDSQFKSFRMPDKSLDMRMLGFAVSLRFDHPLQKGLLLYGRGGAGYYNIHMKTASLDAPAGNGGITESVSANLDWTLGFHAGGGLSYSLTERWEAHLDFSYLFIEPEATLTVSERHANTTRDYRVEDKLGYNHGLLMLGITYSF